MTEKSRVELPAIHDGMVGSTKADGGQRLVEAILGQKLSPHQIYFGTRVNQSRRTDFSGRRTLNEHGDV